MGRRKWTFTCLMPHSGTPLLRYSLWTTACRTVRTRFRLLHAKSGEVGCGASLRIGPRIAEHLQEGGAEELVRQPDGLLPLPPDGVGLVEDGGDATLLGEGWQKDGESA